MDVEIHEAMAGELDAAALYAFLKLRSDVFVVEQQCAYPELDGRDLEAATRHLWINGDDGSPAAYVRVLADPGAVRIGRVVTARAHRGQRLAERLILHALATTEGDAVLDAQAYLQVWYERFGFAVSGPGYVEDGIPHVPMRLRR
ncbi:MAG TPA: GNAT family N-acetyltransferase [Acidimicrobiales bacterium]